MNDQSPFTIVSNPNIPKGTILVMGDTWENLRRRWRAEGMAAVLPYLRVLRFDPGHDDAAESPRTKKVVD